MTCFTATRLPVDRRRGIGRRAPDDVGRALAFDQTKYPDWSGQWRKPPGIGNQWDPTKPPGRGQQAPLNAEYQAIFEASLADQAAGGQGADIRITCVSPGMPRMMTAVRPFEFVITPNVTYINFENNQPRRIYTDGRSFPKDEEATWPGYSIGTWHDTDNDGRFDTLEVETRNFKGPRIYEASGIPLHSDNETIVRSASRSTRRTRTCCVTRSPPSTTR